MLWWRLLGEGHAGQVDKEDDVILEERYPFLNLSSGDVPHKVLEADASVGEDNTGLLQMCSKAWLYYDWRTEICRATV